MGLLKKHKGFIILIIMLFLTTLGFFYKRYDFTNDKRYTLTQATQKIISKINNPLEITIYLQGNFPAKYITLQQETVTLLEEFQQKNSNISFTIIDPIKDLPSLDSLKSMGLKPSIISQINKGQASQMILFPYAVAFYKGFYNKIPLLVENSGKNEDEMLTFSVENLEYSLTNAINNLVSEKTKKIGFVTHHKELQPIEFYSFQVAMSENYSIQPFFPSDSTSKGYTLKDIVTSKQFDALVIAKPRIAFTEEDKELIDQFIMNGGKTMWMLDAVNAEMDTLYRSDKILAYPYNLNITDLLFAYGIRLNTILIKDAQRSAQLNFVVGETQGTPQFQTFNWSYFPLGIADIDNPITKNISPVKFEFPASIDTLNNGIKKTILYQSSLYTSTMSVPSFITMEELYSGLSDSIKALEYNKGPKILSVLLEGEFTSAYAGRIERNEIPNFKAKSVPNKMIIIADGDMPKNQTYSGKPMELGQDKMTKITYGNKAFLKNAMDYLLDDIGLIELRNRNIEMKLLDQQKILSKKLKWQWINILLPLFIITLMGSIFIFFKRKMYN